MFWIFLLPFFTAMQYSTGFLVFAVIILVRLVANLYTNNVFKLSTQRYDRFPFRIP